MMLTFDTMHVSTDKHVSLSRDNGGDSLRSKSSRLFSGADSSLLSVGNSGSGSVDRRCNSHSKSIDRKSSGSDYSAGSGSRKSSSDRKLSASVASGLSAAAERKLSASRHSLLSRGSDI